ncbi:MAG: hypothetical protein HKN58_00050 [Xanthomonadales bacterium]|nr:hypothetical protein [Xanthomonadales bacterium]
MSTHTEQHDLNKRLALYTGIAGALVAGTAQAAPTPSTSPDFPLTLNASDSDSFDDTSFDVDGAGDEDFQFYLNYNGDCDIAGALGYSYLSDLGYGGSIAIVDQYYAGMISPGTPLPGSQDFDSYAYLFGCNYGVDNADTDPGPFPPASRGFVGIRFEVDSNTHYGYLDVETFDGAQSIGVTIHSACFESTPDTTIVVGACDPQRIAPVPVGGLIPLSLGVLALGGMALRRRKTHS